MIAHMTDTFKDTIPSRLFEKVKLRQESVTGFHTRKVDLSIIPFQITVVF